MADCFVRGYDPDAAEKQGVKKTLTDRLIQLRSKLTHSEFQFSQRYGSVSFSFTLADHVKGARFKKITYTHPTRWETVPVPLTDDEEDISFAAACVLAGLTNKTYQVRDWAVESYETSLKNKRLIVYDKRNHWKYDLIGLLSFADEEPLVGRDSKILAAIRPALWGWAKYVRPAKKRAWCSEGCAMVIHESVKGFSYAPDTLTPDSLLKAVRMYFGSRTNARN